MKVVNFSLNLPMTIWWMITIGLYRPPRGQVRHVTSRGSSRVVTNVVSDHEAYESGFRFQESRISRSSRVSFIGGKSQDIYEWEAVVT